MKFKPFPEIKTERLLLRKIEELDCDTILFLRSNKTVNKFIERPETKKIKNKTDAIKYINEINEAIEKNKSISWGITYKTNRKIIGTICLWNFSKKNKTAEVGYDLNPEFQGLGIMSEALNSIIDFGFNNLKLDTVEAFTHWENENSRKLLEKKGFVLIEHRKGFENDSNIIFELKNTNI